MTDDLTAQLAKIHRKALADQVYTRWEDLTDDAIESSVSAINAVLAELHHQGMLVPAGGLALTAEQVEDVRLVIEAAKPSGVLAYRLLALFPATEPAEATLNAELKVPAPSDESARAGKAPTAEVEVMQWDGTRKSIQTICDWVNSFDDELDDPTISYCFSSAAPDDVLDVSLATNEGDFVRVSGGDFIVRDTQGNFYRRDRNAYATVDATPPVAPAPAETDWPTWDAVPEGVKYRSEGDPRSCYFVNHGGIIYLASGRPSTVSEFAMQELAPFVAAPAETKWQDISEAPKHLTLIDRAGDKWTYDGDNWVTPETAILPVLYINRKYAPFVAAKEGKA
ncbi:hypothetical protein ABH922_002769 [Rhodococcus sp. 27YEA15]|uniref:hypothetical protein n=1 Tax=Rhodococcus sp. 27YEA15 TaxID=3156259 RepID=UPI003C7E9DB8